MIHFQVSLMGLIHLGCLNFRWWILKTGLFRSGWTVLLGIQPHPEQRGLDQDDAAASQAYYLLVPLGKFFVPLWTDPQIILRHAALDM